MANKNERIDVNINTTTNMPKEIRQIIESARERNKEIDSLKSQISELRGIITTKEAGITATYYKGGGTSGSTPVLRDDADLKELQATRKSIESDRERLKELNRELQNMGRISNDEIRKLEQKVSETKARLTRSKHDRENPSQDKIQKKQEEYNRIQKNATAPSDRREKGRQSFESKGVYEATRAVLKGESTKVVEDRLKTLEQGLLDYTRNISSINEDIRNAEQALSEAEANFPTGDKRIQEAAKRLKTLKGQLGNAQTSKKRAKSEVANVRNQLVQMRQLASKGEAGFISPEHAKRAMKSGEAIPLQVELDTSWNKEKQQYNHNYRYTGPGGQKYFETYGAPISATAISSLLTGYKSNEQLQKEEERLREEANKQRNSVKAAKMRKEADALKNQRINTQRAASFGTAHHKIVEKMEAGNYAVDSDGLILASEIQKILSELAKEEATLNIPKDQKIYSKFLTEDGNLVYGNPDDNYGGSALVRTVHSYQKFANEQKKRGKVMSSEKALGMLMKVGDRVVPIAGTADQLWLANELSKNGSPQYELFDMKTTGAVHPETAIQLGILSKLFEANGTNIGKQAVIHTGKKYGRPTAKYNFDPIGDKDLLRLLGYAFDIRDISDEQKKDLLRMKAAPFWRNKMHGVVSAGSYLKDGQNHPVTLYNGQQLYDIMKYSTWKKDDPDSALDIYNSLSEEGKRHFSNDLWLTKTSEDGTKDNSKLVRTGKYWDKLREIIPSPMGLAVRGQNTGGAEFKEFTTEDGKTFGGMAIGGLYGSEWVKAYELAVAQTMQKAIDEKKTEAEAKKLAREAGQKVMNNMASLIDKELKRQNSGPEGDAAYLNARSFIRSFENSYLYNPNASRAIDAFGQIDTRYYGGLDQYYRELRDADIGGEAQYRDKEEQSESRRSKALTEDSGPFAQKLTDLYNGEVTRLLSTLSGEASDEKVLDNHAKEIQSMFSHIRSYSSIWKEALYMLGNESELNEFGKPELLNNAMSILDIVSNFKNSIRDKITNSKLSDKDKQSLMYRLNESLNLESTQNPVIGQQVAYRLTRGIAASDFYESQFAPYWEKANERARATGGKEVSLQEFLESALTGEQMAQYKASKVLKGEYLRFLNGEAYSDSIFDYLNQMAANPTVMASREGAGLMKQWETYQKIAGPDQIKATLDKIIAQQLFDKEGNLDFSKQFGTFKHGLEDVHILEGKPIDKLGARDTEADFVPGYVALEEDVNWRLGKRTGADVAAAQDLEREAAIREWEQRRKEVGEGLVFARAEKAQIEEQMGSQGYSRKNSKEYYDLQDRLVKVNTQIHAFEQELRTATQSLHVLKGLGSESDKLVKAFEAAKKSFTSWFNRRYKGKKDGTYSTEEAITEYDNSSNQAHNIQMYKRKQIEREGWAENLAAANERIAKLETSGGSAKDISDATRDRDIAQKQYEKLTDQINKANRVAEGDLKGRLQMIDLEAKIAGTYKIYAQDYGKLSSAKASIETSKYGVEEARKDAVVLRELREEEEAKYKENYKALQAENEAKKQKANAGGVATDGGKKPPEEPHQPPQGGAVVNKSGGGKKGGAIITQSGDNGFVIKTSGALITPAKPTKKPSGALIPYTPGALVPYKQPETPQDGGGAVVQPQPKRMRKVRSDKGVPRGPRKPKTVPEDEDTVVLPPPQTTTEQTVTSQPVTVNGTQQTVANGPVNIQVASGNVQIDINASNVAENITNSTIQMIRGAVGGGGTGGSGGPGGSGGSGGSGGGSGGGNGGNTGDASNQAANGDANRVKSLTTISQLLNQHISLYKEIEKENRTIALLAQDQSDEGKLATKEAKDRRRELMEMSKDVRTQIKEEYGKLTPEAQAAFGEKARVRIQGARQSVAIQDTRALYDARDDSAKEYERLLTTRLQIESKIDQFEQRRNTAGWGPEIDALRAAIEGQQKLLALNQEDLNVLKQRGLLRAEDAKRIEAQYAAQRSAQKASNATNMHATRNIWDMMGYDIKRSFSMIFNFGVAHRAIASIRMQIQQLITTLKDLDVAMTNIRIVTGQTNEEATELMKTYNDLASQLGTTTKAIAEASNEWLRQGYTVSESQDLITASTYLSKLGMIDASQATEYLTSLLKGFKLEASEAADAVSMLTKLDMEFAASSGDIAEGLSRMATTAQMAGMSLEEAAAAVTVIKDVSQKSASSIGESLKTLLSRYGNVKAGSFVDLETGEADESLNDTEKVLNAIGISIRSSSMEFRDFSDVLDELADKWIALTSVEKNAVATAMAGTRQRENFNILMENYDSYRDAVDSASDSEGIAQEKYEAYLDSVEAHLNRLQTAWESFMQTFQGSDFYKGILTITTKLVEGLPIILRNVINILAILNAYKMPIWLKQLGGLFTAPSAHSGRFVGAYGGMIRGTLFGQGRQDRANIMNYEFYKARAAVDPKAAEKMKKYEQLLPQGYRDKMLSSSAVDVQPVVAKTEEVKQVLQGIGSNVARIASTPGGTVSGAANATASASVAATVKTSGADPTVVKKFNDEIEALKKDKMKFLGRKGGYATKYYSMSESTYEDIQTQKAKMNSATGDIGKINDQINAKIAERDVYLDSCLTTEKAIIAEGQKQLSQKEGAVSLQNAENAAVSQEVAKEKENTVEKSKQEAQGAKEIANQNLDNSATTIELNNERLITEELREQNYLAGMSGVGFSIPRNAMASGQIGYKLNRNGFGSGKKYKENLPVGMDQTRSFKRSSKILGRNKNQLQNNMSGEERSPSVFARMGASKSLTIMSGLTSFMTGVATTEGDTSDKIASGAIQAGTTMLGSLAGPVGAMIGSAAGQVLSPLIMNWIHAEEKAREERIKEAQERTRALQENFSTIEDTLDKLKNADEWSAEDYSSAFASVSELTSMLADDSELRNTFMAKVRETVEDTSYTISDAMNQMVHGSEEERALVGKLLQISYYQELQESQSKAQEGERLQVNEDLDKALRESQDKMDVLVERSGKGHDAVDEFLIRENRDILNLYAKEREEGTYVSPNNVPNGGLGDLISWDSIDKRNIANTTQANSFYFNVVGSSVDDKINNLEILRARLQKKQDELEQIAAAGTYDNGTYDMSYYLHKDEIQWGIDAVYEFVQAIDDQIEAYQEQKDALELLNAELHETEMNLAFFKSQVSDWSSIDIKTTTLEDAVQEIADNLSLTGVVVRDALGRVTEDARAKIEDFLRTQDEYSSLFSGGDATLRQLLNNNSKTDSLLERIKNGNGREGMGVEGYDTYEQLRYLFDYSTETNILERQKIADAAQMDVEQLRKQVYALDPQRLVDYANALGMNETEVAKLKNTFGNTTLGDLLSTPDEVIDDMETMLSIMEDLADTGKITADNLIVLFDKMPELLYSYDENGDIIGMNYNNIIPNLINELTGKGNLFEYTSYEDIKQNTNVFEAFVAGLSEAEQELLIPFENFSDDALAAIKSGGFYQKYIDFMKGLSADSEAYESLVNMLIDYENTMLEQQIEALETQKEALSKSNEEREKELQLIKAKMALENAQKEKKLVYRQGIGWTYEADQNAVQEAKKEVEDLETQKEEDNIQYQIDELTKLQDYLEAIPDSAALEKQKQIYEAWTAAVSDSNKKQLDILDELKNAYEKLGQFDFTDEATNDKGQDADPKKNAISTLLGNSSSEGSISYVESALEAYNATEENSMGRNQQANILNEAVSNAYKKANEAGVREWTGNYGNDKDAGLIADDSITEEDYNKIYNFSKNWESYNRGQQDIVFENVPEITNKLGSAVNYQGSSKKVGSNTNKTYTTAELTTGAKWGNDVGAYNTNKEDYLLIFDESNSKWDQVAANERQLDFDYDSLKPGTLIAFVTDKNRAGPHLKVKNYDGLWMDAWYFAEGTESAPGGPAFVNEEGIEGIITPQGTLTSLPARSGVVPADLTKNLWTLGEVAPNLIRNLDSFTASYPEKNVTSADDHSTNIGNLYATFQANENFDFDQFLTDIRSAISLNRHIK